MFERMEIAEAIYKGEVPSKNTQRAEANPTSFQEEKGVGAVSPFNPEKGRSGKCK